MDLTGNTVKRLLFIFNVIFVICGILLITWGSIVLSSMGQISSLQLGVLTQFLPSIIVIMGCIIFFVSFCGCCGAIRDNVCRTTTYAVFMCILFGLQLVLINVIFNLRSRYLSMMETVAEKIWEENAFDYSMGALQLNFKCCGLDSYKDYANKKQVVPSSCCGNLSQSAACSSTVYSTKPGCKATFVNFWATYTNILGYGLIGVALVELVAFAFACLLVSRIRKSRT